MRFPSLPRTVLGLLLVFPPTALADAPPPHGSILVMRCDALADRGIPYVYGGTTMHGMDCSASVQRLFRDLGHALPRTSEAQANHLARQGRLWRSAPGEDERLIFSRLKPGDLLFWAGNDSPNRISHVMVFVRMQEPGRAILWGARGRRKTGRTGSGVDYFDYRLGRQKGRRLAAYGRPVGR